ncbi:MAG: LPP20 family lipoprotein [Gammaproteobacteria bacterium]
MIMNSRILAGSVMIASLGLVIGGCSSKQEQPQVLTPVAECTYPGTTNAAAPLWVCDAPVEGYDVTAVGAKEKTAAGVQFQKDQAAASARVALANRMKVQVQNMIKQYAETTGTGDSETVDQVATSVSKLITNETLVGSKIIRSATAPNGTAYVLVALAPAEVQQIAEQSVKTSMNNEKALWQKFQAGKAQDELAAEIAKQSGEFKAAQ